MSLSPSLFDKETLCILTAFGTGTCISVSLAAAAAAALTAWPVVTGTAGSSSFLPEGGK